MKLDFGQSLPLCLCKLLSADQTVASAIPPLISAMPTFDKSSWTALQPAFNEHIKSPDARAAAEAACALYNLLQQGSAPTADLTGLPPEPVAKALLGTLHRLCTIFPALPTALQRDPSVYATVRAAAKVNPDLETVHGRWYTEFCVWLQPPQSEEQGRHQSGYAMTVSGASLQGTNAAGHTSAAASAAKALPCDQGAIPSGEGTRVAMFSARFDGGEMEMKFREVHKILLANNYNVLMVDVRSGENFGKLTTRYLNRVYEESGTLLAVCTPNYGEKTASAHSSHEELIFALDNKDRVQILPLRVVDTYPPQPPFGPDHPFDKEGDARGLVRRLFPPSTVFQDCRKKSEIQIAAEIAERLRAHRFSA